MPVVAFLTFLQVKNFTSVFKYLLFNFSGTPPEFITAPSAIANTDGFTNITGCVYVVNEDLGVDLAEFSF